MHSIVNSANIHVENSLEVLFRSGLEFPDVSDAGTVDENIDTTMLRYNVVDRLGYIVLKGNVAYDWCGVSASGSNARCSFFKRLGVDIDKEYSGFSFGEQFGDGFTNSASCTGYDSDFVVEIKHDWISDQNVHRGTHPILLARSNDLSGRSSKMAW